MTFDGGMLIELETKLDNFRRMGVLHFLTLIHYDLRCLLSRPGKKGFLNQAFGLREALSKPGQSR